MTTEAVPVRPIDPDWLALRERADARARDRAAEAVLPPLLAACANPSGDGLRVVDLGAGTGANLRWLAPRLPDPAGQRWILVDHDPRLTAWAPAGTTSVRRDVAGLGDLLPTLGRVDLVTASALLDLLTGSELSAVVGAVVVAGCPALFSLTVNGDVRISPTEECDAALAAAFDSHQRQGCRLGPDAATVATSLFRGHGWSVVEASTPWLLNGDDGPLLDAWLVGRAEAAVELHPGLASTAAGWLGHRRTQLRAGQLDAAVGHVDVLALPPEREPTGGAGCWDTYGHPGLAG